MSVSRIRESERDRVAEAKGSVLEKERAIGRQISNCARFAAISLRVIIVATGVRACSRAGISQEQPNSRELLSARTRPCLFASPCVVYAGVRRVGVTCFPALKNLSPFCAPTYTCTYRRAVDRPRAVAIKSEKSWGAV